MWMLWHGDTFIAAFRFKPKRHRVTLEEGDGYYIWTDCNGAVKNSFGIITNGIEGSMNAKCISRTIEFSLPITNRKRKV